MTAILEILDRGGWAMFAIIALSVVLYSSCCQLLLDLNRRRRNLPRQSSANPTLWLRWRREAEELRENFRRERTFLGAMIAAAPLLGLLGTVNGMAKTFESLSTQMGQKSMEGLAGGISEVLICTESGLAVALPALLLVHVAHRQMRRQLQQLNQLEQAAKPKAAS